MNNKLTHRERHRKNYSGLPGILCACLPSRSWVRWIKRWPIKSETDKSADQE